VKTKILVAGYWSLVAGYWLLVAGYWLLVAGYWLLGTGCWLLVAGTVGYRADLDGSKPKPVGPATVPTSKGSHGLRRAQSSRGLPDNPFVAEGNTS
jgi:hypothetical protein